MKKIILFASGSGSNVDNILNYFQDLSLNISFTLFTNNPKAKVIEKVEKRGVPINIFDRSMLNDGTLSQLIREIQPDLMVLAGFLWKFPDDLVRDFPNKIINIHPALLPKYGGKGMYGQHVHQAVVLNKERESGITIHYVNENYDEGGIIFQATTPISCDATAEDVAEAVLKLEHQHFPAVILQLLNLSPCQSTK